MTHTILDNCKEFIANKYKNICDKELKIDLRKNQIFDFRQIDFVHQLQIAKAKLEETQEELEKIYINFKFDKGFYIQANKSFTHNLNNYVDFTTDSYSSFDEIAADYESICDAIIYVKELHIESEIENALDFIFKELALLESNEADIEAMKDELQEEFEDTISHYIDDALETVFVDYALFTAE